MDNTKNNETNDILDNIIMTSEHVDFQVSEDIYDVSGQKLLAKGYKVTPSIREKMLNKILKKPIETCISADGGITNADIANTAQILIKNSPLLNQLSIKADDEVAAFQAVEIAPLASMLLTVMKEGESNKLNHAILVTLIARSIAHNMNLSQQELSHLTIAGLLHDIGELYVSVPQSGELTIGEWRKVMAHPVLGGSVVKLYMGYPVAVSTAIYEHHARCDGTGYPQDLDADNCSTIGQVLILAEAVAGMLKPGVEAKNVIVAFNLSSGVYPSKPQIQLNNMLKSLPHVRGEVDKNNTVNRLRVEINALNEVQSKLGALLKGNDNPPLIQRSAQHLQYRVDKLKQSIFASGIQYYLEDNSWIDTEDNQIIMLELEITTNEIGWQIQDMLRDTTLRLIDFKFGLPTDFAEITEQLAQVNLNEMMTNAK